MTSDEQSPGEYGFLVVKKSCSQKEKIGSIFCQSRKKIQIVAKAEREENLL